jgi:hypothetical protein
MQAAARECFACIATYKTGFMSAGKYLTQEFSGLPLGRLREPNPTTAPDGPLVARFRKLLDVPPATKNSFGRGCGVGAGASPAEPQKSEIAVYR